MPTTNDSRNETANRLRKAPEIADFLQTSVKTVYDMANAGEIPFIRVGARMRFLERDVIDHLRGQR
jgi:excisionase family DNA binding protein